ncbi:MAG: transketolase [Candidatus Riflebacteria bacterium]|nr:transketolase [Candidatus Riflebacteria bacterium]
MPYDKSKVKELKHRAAKIRLLSIETTAKAGSGHPTSCCSCAEALAVMFFHSMKYLPQDPGNAANDRLVLSKGHAAPALYAAWSEAGYLKEEELYTLREMGSRIEGHPMPSLPFVDVATGSLGQGLACGLGIAVQQRSVLKNNARTYVLMGDGEMAEGSVWEAMSLASAMKVDNLIAVVDVNRLGQSRETILGHDMATYEKRVAAFGWEAITVEKGNDVESVLAAFDKAETVTGKPVCILLKTFKGAGMTEISDKDNWHGKPLKDDAVRAKAIEDVSVDIMKNPPAPQIKEPAAVKGTLPTKPESYASVEKAPYEKGSKAATREAVGPALVNVGGLDKRVWVIDGDTQNSTYSQKFAEKYPERFIECFIAEQNMAGVGAGLAARGLVPVAVTFGAFLVRAADQIRMAALSGLPVKFIGTHAGISIGEDGASQMALEDLAFFATLPNGAVFYPSDGVSAYKCILNLIKHDGPGYVRLSRPSSPIIYNPDETFEIGGLKVVHAPERPTITAIASGVILHELLKAAKSLVNKVDVQVVDLYSIKPFPTEELKKLVEKTNGKVAVFEEHSPNGGIGSEVSRNLAGTIKKFKHSAVTSVPCSGTPEELLAAYGLSADKIAETLENF